MMPHWGGKVRKELEDYRRIRGTSTYVRATFQTMLTLGGTSAAFYLGNVAGNSTGAWIGTGIFLVGMGHLFYEVHQKMERLNEILEEAYLLKQISNSLRYAEAYNPRLFISYGTKHHRWVGRDSWYEALTEFVPKDRYGGEAKGRLPYFTDGNRLYIAGAQGIKGVKPTWAREVREFLLTVQEKSGLEVYMVYPGHNASLKPHPGLRHEPKLPYFVYNKLFLGPEEIHNLWGVFDSKGYYVLVSNRVKLELEDLPNTKPARWVKELFEQKSLKVKRL
ncbi:MAG: hypothetical protein GXN92_02655 [Candidatus Micrarchaeota archaeon]|nr:hypothetical protein [Candidatus Micrarchaeota archaeon]